ncbi:unnamed protein product [Cuscuta europaea]|uniref:Pectin acetylesterase n=1 Tax=Cuscuta europaea TaxID=41803 RepID=A0A9P1E3G9_CUSEU|nr:unnamed protein product [Cuscuta europaea]
MGFALKGFGEVLLITSIMAAAAALPNDGNPNLVNATLVKADKKAVCLLGNPAAYFHAPGYGKGIQNWIVYLPVIWRWVDLLKARREVSLVDLLRMLDHPEDFLRAVILPFLVFSVLFVMRTSICRCNLEGIVMFRREM